MSRTNGLPLRPYQLQASRALEEARDGGHNRALVHLATGLGKTVLAASDALSYQDKHGGRILFVSHMNEINSQAMATFKKMGDTIHLTCATFQSLYSRLDVFDPKEFDYIVWDEAHHTEAATFKAVREHFQPKFELGLTATPTRADGLDILEYFGEPVFVKGLAEGIAENWLSSVDYHIVLDDAVKMAVKDGFSAKTLDEIRALFAIRVRNEVIAANVMEKREDIGLASAKTIVFCQNQQNAEEMALLLGGQAYHAGVPSEARKKIMGAFRKGSLQIICTVDMFNEGVDIPDARLVVFLRSTSSATIFQQQLGRGLRRSKGKKSVTVLDFVANVERIDLVRDLGHTISRERTKIEAGARSSRSSRPSMEPTVAFQAQVNQEDFFASNFVFEDSTIELLERFKEIKRPVITEFLPEGYMSDPQLAEELNVRHGAPRDFASNRGWSLVLYKSGSQNMPTAGFSPEQVEIIKKFYKARQSLAVSHTRNVISLKKAADTLHKGISTMKNVCLHIGITPRAYFFTKQSGIGITVEEFERIKGYFENGWPVDVLSTAQVKEKLGMNKREGVEDYARKLGIQSFLSRGGNMYGAEQVRQIGELRAQEMAKLPSKPGVLDPTRAYAAYKEHGSIRKAGDALGYSSSSILLAMRRGGYKTDQSKRKKKIAK